MANTYRNAAGLNPEDVYDADVKGDGPDAAISGIGYRNAAGVLLRFAALKYGAAAANHGCRLADGRDFSALWAKKGTAVYAAVISNPGYFSLGSSYVMTGALTYSVTSRILLSAGGTWSVLNSSSGSAGIERTGNWYGPPAAGVGAAYQVKFTFTLSSGVSPTISNGASDWISLGSDRSFSASLSATISTPKDMTGTLRIQIRRTSDSVILSDQTLSMLLSLQQM